MDDPDNRSNAVAVEQIDGQWAVIVVEGDELTQRIFETEEFAINFASGQAARLGVTLNPAAHREADDG